MHACICFDCASRVTDGVGMPAAIPTPYWLLIAALVKAGYVVAAPTHNDGSAARLGLLDGTELPYQFEQMIVAAGATAGGEDEAVEAAEGDHKVAIMKAHRRSQLLRRVAELMTSLDFVLSPEATGPRSGGGLCSVDASRVAYLGHSFGGATAFMASELDARCCCAVCYDPWVEAGMQMVEVVGKSFGHLILSRIRTFLPGTHLRVIINNSNSLAGMPR